MNCRPGDLAIIVRVECASEQWFIGRIVRCVAAFQRLGGTCWTIETPLYGPDGTKYTAAFDRSLKPLRDPGDDARDESFSWCPAPENVTA